LETVLPYADRIYFDNCDKIVEAREMCARSNKELVALLPRFDPLDDFAETEYPVMVNTPGQYHACRKSPRIYASSNMNFFNSYFPLKLYQATLSTELSRREISDLVKHSGIRTEVMVFGRMELMVTRDPGMDNCVLKDEKDISFPVYRDRYGYSRILNSADLNLIGNIGELGRMGVDSVGFDLRKRPPALARAVCEACVSPASESKLEEICGGFTRGLYQRGV
ncbi:MAG: U32 family peptidase, partial [Candidatus Methanomethylophilaceae archaeon]|nr:U32 family peptidase [Candidatus Methanomethylophilaceae archaeon]